MRATTKSEYLGKLISREIPTLPKCSIRRGRARCRPATRKRYMRHRKPKRSRLMMSFTFAALGAWSKKLQKEIALISETFTGHFDFQDKLAAIIHK